MKKILIDCDPGTDDAHAILMAVAHDNLGLVAITTVFGNVGIDQATTNALRILQVCQATQVPVYKGSRLSLIGQGSAESGYHGKDGLGDVASSGEPASDLSSIQDEHAVNAILRLANEHSGELVVVAMGPLTNIALALHLDAHLGNKISHLIIMGGNSTGRGNVTAAAEFNFWSDPEAAMFVLQEYRGRITLLDLEVCQKFSPSWDFQERLLVSGTPKARFLGAIIEKLCLRLKSLNVPKLLTYDQSALAVVINDKVVMETKDVYVTIELAGSATRGQMVVDWQGKLGREPNVQLVTKLDLEVLEHMMITATRGDGNGH